MERRLAAILAADVVGYSRLMGMDEEATLTTLRDYREVIDSLVAGHRGRVFGSAGDSVIAEFASPVEAVRCALEVQRELDSCNAGLANDRRMELRIGVNLGDVVAEGGNLHGDGVNIAARLEQLAEPGGVCLSGMVHDHLAGKLEIELEDLGECELKNIARPVRVWRWVRGDRAPSKDLHLPPSEKPSIAVLPFSNLSGDSDQEYFSDGITEDIITELSRFKSLDVIARNSSFAYKGGASDTGAIARDLAVRYLLQGSLRRAGDNVRIGTQLLEAASGKQLWAERYDREVEDIFAVQDEITGAILGALLPEIGAAEAERAKRSRPEELDAWALYHRGLDHLYRYSRYDNREARALFRQAIAKDPGFAASYAGLAYACFLAVHDDYTDHPDERISEGLEAARQAVKLDSNEALAHAALGRILTMRREHERAIAACDTAIDLNPSLAPAYFGRGYALTMIGRAEEAVVDLGRAIELSPRDPNVWAFLCISAWAQTLCGRHQEAHELAERAARHLNTNFWAPATLAVANANLGRQVAARRALEDALAAKPDLTFAYIGETLPFRDALIRDGVFGSLRELGLPASRGAPTSDNHPALPDKPSIAVLPFDNMSGDPEQEYFADGMVEEIITALSHLRWLFVIARNSTFTYKGRAVDVRQVGQELGVRYVLEGSVRKALNRVRISGQLIDAETGAHLWAGHFDGTLEDVFDLQDQVTASVVGAIAPKLEQAEIERAKRKPTENLDAYDYYLRGMAGVYLWDREAHQEALSHFYKAIELDSNFASAYGMAARCYSWRKVCGWMVEPEKETAEAVRLAKRASVLGQEDALALCTAGMALAYVAGQVEEGDALIEQALVLNPNLAWAWLFSGWVKVWLGEPELAIERELLAMRLSPNDSHIFNMQAAIAAGHFLAGRYEESLSWAKIAKRGRANAPLQPLVAAAGAALAGDQAEAASAMAHIRSLVPGLRLSNLGEFVPIRRPEDLARWSDGLRIAGLPE